ncbi:hypothetical protein [Serratia marcescens]|uniref:hypothetical protein n=1 Tax=Serratia marcescens TaxID=615 RepID=UPI0013DB391A|nr:hypothetical protein [Serratia marcescens]
MGSGPDGAIASLPHAAALCHLLALLDRTEDPLRALLWRVFLPLLRQTQGNQLLE